MRWILALLLLVACTDPALDPELHGQVPADEPNVPGELGDLNVVTEEVEYTPGVTGFYAHPAEGTYPGVIMIHEWWGLNENVKTMAVELASQGYSVLAVDLYNGVVATTPDESRKAMTSVVQEEAISNMRDAGTFLRAEGSEQLASLGWCFGGKQSLQIGLAEDLDATVIYYGQLETDPTVLSAMEQPVLGIFGSEDQSIPVNSVRDFEASLNELGVENEIHVYEGANHAFANPSGDRYDAEAAEDAWTKTLAFLDENLQ